MYLIDDGQILSVTLPLSNAEAESRARLKMGDLQRASFFETFGPLNSQISSMTLSTDHKLLLVTTLGGTKPGQAMFKWLDGGSPELNYRVEMDGSVWCSAANPQISDGYLDFAIGTQRQLLIASVLPYGNAEFFQHRWPRGSAQSGFQAVDWLDKNIIISGLRNGSVFLWDGRASGNGATSQRIQHGSSICHVRALNHNKVVVAGMEDRVSCRKLHPTVPFPPSLLLPPTKSHKDNSLVSFQNPVPQIQK